MVLAGGQVTEDWAAEGVGGGRASGGREGWPGMISWHHASGWFCPSCFFKSSSSIFGLFGGASSSTALGLKG